MYHSSKLVDLYDCIHEEVVEDIPFILEWASSLRGDLLEVGCGSGRVLLPLIQHGISVTGVDPSAEMLAKLRIQAPSTTLIEADILTAEISQKFAGILISYNTLMHIPASQLSLLWKKLAHLLQPNGSLLIDVANPIQLSQLEDLPMWEVERELHLSSSEQWTQWSRFFVDSAEQQIRVDWKFSCAAEDDLTTQTLYHYHYPHHLQMSMTKAGISWEHTYGGYDKSPFDSDSPRLLVFAQK